MVQKPPKPPDDLGEGGRELWDAIAQIGPLRADRRRLLEEAAFTADLIDRLRAELRNGSTTTRGSQGQTVADPRVSELRQYSNTLRSLLSALDLPVEERDSSAETLAARDSAMALARRRWSKAGTA